MNELPDILNRALGEPIRLTFGDADEAKSWVFRAHKFRARYDAKRMFAQLMISRRGHVVTIKVPTMHIEGVNDGN